MLKIQMIRHGRTYGNSIGRYIGTTNEPLMEGEAARLSAYEPEAVQCVFASPMLRCKETARILFPDQKPELLDDFRECDFGDFENKNYQELSGNEQYQTWIDSGGTIGFPGGESQTAFQSRCKKAFDEMIFMCMERGYDSVAMVVHGGTIMSIMEAYGIPKAGYFKWQVKNGEGYKVRMQPELWHTGIKELIVDEKITGEESHVW
ncbi:MAG: histidine phosphatase family protein [Lachnospiraceae bacterium]|nr:histidine phosphatase family protein [Lachnospiraceae bacterium]